MSPIAGKFHIHDVPWPIVFKIHFAEGIFGTGCIVLECIYLVLANNGEPAVVGGEGHSIDLGYIDLDDVVHGVGLCS